MANSYREEESIENLGKSALDDLSKHSEFLLNEFIKSLTKSIKNLPKESKKAYDEMYSDLQDLEEQYSKHRIDMFAKGSDQQKKLIEIQNKYESELYKKSRSAREKSEILYAQKSRIENFKNDYENALKLQKKLAAQEDIWRKNSAKRDIEIAEAKTEAEKKRIIEKHALEEKKLLEAKNKTAAYIESHRDQYKGANTSLNNKALEIGTVARTSKDSDLMHSAAKELKEAAKRSVGDAEKKKQLEHEARMTEKAALAQEAKDRNKDRVAELKYRLTTLDGIKDTLGDAAKAMVNGLSNMFDSIEQPINSFYEYQAKYEARLQGSENRYNKMMTEINKQIGLSPFVKQSKMVENLQRLIDSGVNYNLELRAYLGTISENIAATFDAFDSNLLRLIRIQQNDSTAARLGIEAALTQMLNNMYSDTSYLGGGSGGGLSDTVSGYLLDAAAMLTHQGAAEMEFVAQKWLGSLYSIGVSDTAIQSIAQGLGYLGSGNVEALNGNETLMSLLAMSASRGGTDLTEIMTGGLTAEKTNKLLQGMVNYLADIANNTDSNNVTRSAIAQVFGLTNTDLRSISNLTTNDISNIATTELNYAGALAETANQLTQISSRMHRSTMISNLIDNATVGSALTIGGNPALYGMYKALNVVSGLVGDRGLEIPGIQALGSGTASGIDILSIAKAAMAGGTLLSTLISSFSNIGSGGLPSLTSWGGYEKSLERGSGLKLQPAGVQSGFSESAQYVSRSNTSTDDLTAASMQNANSQAKQNMNEEDQKLQTDAEKFYEEGREYLQKLADAITSLDATTSTNNMHVFVTNSNDKPILAKIISVENAVIDSLKVLANNGLLTGITSDNTSDSPDIWGSLISALRENPLSVNVENMPDVTIMGGNS